MTESSAKLRVVSADTRVETRKSLPLSARDYLVNEKLREEAKADKLRVAMLQARDQGRQL